MFGFGKKKPCYESDETYVDISLDGSGKVSDGGKRWWRFSSGEEDNPVGAEVKIRGRRARITESSDNGGYVEFL